MKKYFDDFTRLTLSKMAKKISEMTYTFNNTEVPDKHQRDILNQELVEMMSNDLSVQSVFLDTMYRGLIAFEKENPKLFKKAMMCIDLKIKPSEITAREYYALDMAYDLFENDKKATLINKDLVELYEHYYESGLPQSLEFDDDNTLKN